MTTTVKRHLYWAPPSVGGEGRSLGASKYDFHKKFGFFSRSPLCSRNLYSLCPQILDIFSPSPFCAGGIYGSPHTRANPKPKSKWHFSRSSLSPDSTSLPSFSFLDSLSVVLLRTASRKSSFFSDPCALSSISFSLFLPFVSRLSTLDRLVLDPISRWILLFRDSTVHTCYNAIGYSAKSDIVPTLTHM